MKRKIWLRNPVTKEDWDLLPENPYKEEEHGCALLSIKGMGYQQSVTQEQVEVDYFISKILSSNKPITGILYFKSDEHIHRFQEYIGDFRRQFLLYYSPEGQFEAGDKISSIYYKPVIISQIDKTERDEYGWYACSCSFVPQSDVWKRDVYYVLERQENVGQALVYPYTYEYVYGGRNVYSIELGANNGREVGCLIKITNLSDAPISNLEWFISNTTVDYYGVQNETVQRSKWSFQSGETNVSVTLQPNYTLYVDSNATTQEAKVIYTDGTSQSVVNWQEPSYDYINFVRIKHGENRIVFYCESEEIRIELMYQEQKEII